jgi:membrane-associated phospholipid phosphatase
MDITYPFKVNETISTAVLFIIGLAAPAVIIILVSLLLVPGPTVPKGLPKGLIWRRKLWEWFAGWTGLALSCATAWLITNGMKNLFGHWRPDMLSRCQPDLTNIAKYAIGGFPTTADGAYLVSSDICTTTDQSNLDDGFRSFPSGHASFSAAGLLYLSLFLASKLAITIPFLAPRSYSEDGSYFSAFPSRMSRNRTGTEHAGADSNYKRESIEMGDGLLASSKGEPTVAARNQSAAPPLYLLVFVAIPFLTAIYVTSTRYSDFRHHGFDLLFGFFIGTVTAIFSFRFYHLPISHGAGWAWGPRSRDRAWWAGIGVGSYSTNRAEDSVTPATVTAPTHGDIEAGGSSSSTRPIQTNGSHVPDSSGPYTS